MTKTRDADERNVDVAENLNLVEAEINSLKAKSKALVDTGILSEAQVRLCACPKKKLTICLV